MTPAQKARKEAKRHWKQAAKAAKLVTIANTGDKVAKEQSRTIWTKRINKDPKQFHNPNGKQFANK